MSEDTLQRVVPVKNYIILGILFVIVVVLVIYLSNLYLVYDAHQREIPVIRGTLSEILPDELEHYIMENPSTVIYMCTAADFGCRNYEKDLKRLVEKEDLQESIIYLNLSNVDKKDFVLHFNTNYSYKTDLKNRYPALVVFEDGKVQGILQGSKGQDLSISKTEQFIELHQIKKQGE